MYTRGFTCKFRLSICECNIYKTTIIDQSVHVGHVNLITFDMQHTFTTLSKSPVGELLSKSHSVIYMVTPETCLQSTGISFGTIHELLVPMESRLTSIEPLKPTKRNLN